MAYLTVALNHFRAVQAWMRQVGAEASLNMQNFEIEVRWRHRYFTFFPQFLMQQNGRYGHGQILTKDVIGFIGWLPYQPISWSLSSDKLLFKKHLSNSDIRTPASWTALDQANQDYVLKRSVGSFGYELAGPYRLHSSHSTATPAQAPGAQGTLYAEQFIAGDNLKVWFWGTQSFYAQRQAYPEVQGNGVHTLAELIQQRMDRISQKQPEDHPDQIAMRSSLAYQQVTLDSVPEAGQRIWLDYRYGRLYEHNAVSVETDNALPHMPEAVRSQIQHLGQQLGQALAQQFPVPVLYSVDGVLDQQNRIWWLEMNSNPIFPPDGYPLMFETLFGPQDLTRELH